MSAPLPSTVNVPSLNDALPTAPTAPISTVCHGVGSTAPPVGATLGVGLAVGVAKMGVPETVEVGVGVAAPPGVGVRLGVGVRVGVRVPVGVRVAVGERVGVGLAVAVDVGVAVRVAVGVAVGLSVLVTVTSTGRDSRQVLSSITALATS